MSEERNHLVGLGTFIRSQRRLAELSQRELAKLTKLSDPYVSQIERGLHEPSARVLKALGEALGIPAETLMAKAGWLDRTNGDEPAALSLETAIKNDEVLSDSQKSSMLEMYRAFAAMNATETA